jgi:hypothetical protein
MIHWLNSTIYNQTTVFTGIRQSEFAIVQLQKEIQDFMMELEFVFLGKLPIDLIPPITLTSTLRNVSNLLPNEYTLFAGLNHKDFFILRIL